MVFQARITNIFEIYGPNDDVTLLQLQTLNDFINDLNQVIDDVAKKKELILEGDFNARVGRIKKGKIRGPFCEDCTAKTTTEKDY